VTSKSIRKGAVRSSDLKNNGTRGVDVAEATLGQVPAAARADQADTAKHAASADDATNAQTAQDAALLGGLGPGQLVTARSGAGAVVCGAATAFSDCVSVDITLPRQSRLLLVASGEWRSVGGGQGRCVLEVDDNGTLLGTRTYGEGASAPSDPSALAMTAVTAPIAAGPHHVDMTCRKTTGTIDVEGSDLSVLAVGDA
jgi:hypothetical protein